MFDKRNFYVMMDKEGVIRKDKKMRGRGIGERRVPLGRFVCV